MHLTVRLISGAVFAATLYFQVPVSANQGEVGTLTVSQSGANQWHKVEMIHSYVNPVVILGPPTDNDPAPLALRIRNLRSDSFEFQLDPWNYLPHTHGEETISYLVIESGNYILANGARIEAGIKNGISTSTFSFQELQAGFETPPAIFAQVVTYSNQNPVTVQLHDPQSDRFTLRLLVEEARQGIGHPNEKVGWVAIEPSTMGGSRKYSAGISENQIGFEKVPLSFGSNGFEEHSPFFSHQRNFNDSDTATLRRKEIKSSSTIIYQQEEDSVNPETFHAKDFLGFLVFQSPGELPFVPKPPDTKDDRVTIPPMGMVSVNVLKNDVDQEGDLEPSTLELTTEPVFGTAKVDTTNGRITYSNTTSTQSDDVLSYTVKDSLGQLSDPANLTIQFDNSKRLPNTTLNLPDELPIGDYKLVNAFPGIPLEQPVNMAMPPGENERLFVLEKGGKIIIIDDITSPSPQSKVFMDISSKVSVLAERGLLGLAFHPDYANNRTFFIVYTDNLEPNPDPGPFGITRHTLLSRFKTTPGNPNKADLSSERILIRMIDRDPGHQAGDLEFGPDGYLYMSSGDEGTQTDTFNNTQTITSGFHSGILRFDVDRKPENLEPNPHVYLNTDNQGKAYYKVPNDNPWVGATEFEGKPLPQNAVVRTEFYAVGLRNPWQMSFDPVNGDLWVGDVGTATREEINRIVKGGNYQWAYKEGTVDGTKIGFMPPGFAGIPPVYEYPRPGSSAAVIGGIVYQGDKMIGLKGAYLFGDYQLNKIWSLRIETDNDEEEVVVEEIAYEGGITSFFADPNNGDPLISDFEGKIWHLVEDQAAVPDIASNLS